MNKKKLIESISKKSGLSQKSAEAALAGFIETIEETLAEGKKVQLIGFGTFEPRKRIARIGRNPRTQEKIQIPETTIPAFKAGKQFKDRVAK